MSGEKESSRCLWTAKAHISLHICTIWSGSLLSAYRTTWYLRMQHRPCQSPGLAKSVYLTYPIYTKYFNTSAPSHTCSKIWTSTIHYLFLCLKIAWMSGEQCRPWWDTTFCSVSYGSTLYAQACLSKYLWYICYQAKTVYYYFINFSEDRRFHISCADNSHEKSSLIIFEIWWW